VRPCAEPTSPTGYDPVVSDADRRPLRVALVDDYEIVVQGLARMFASYRDRVRLVELDVEAPVGEPVDVALVDTFGQDRTDDTALQKIVANGLAETVVVYGWSDEDDFIERSLAAGAAGYLAKSLPAGQLVAGLERAYRERGVVVRPEAGTGIADPGDWPGRDEGLTPRESEVVALITLGRSNQEVAAATFLSINSVKSYIRTAYRKMGVQTRSQAVLWGLNHGFGPERPHRADADRT
jgi:DNA-binding NarL/FixJ family response regulator